MQRVTIIMPHLGTVIICGLLLLLLKKRCKESKRKKYHDGGRKIETVLHPSFLSCSDDDARYNLYRGPFMGSIHLLRLMKYIISIVF